jgi:hypothetical protein
MVPRREADAARARSNRSTDPRAAHPGRRHLDDLIRAKPSEIPHGLHGESGCILPLRKDHGDEALLGWVDLWCRVCAGPPGGGRAKLAELSKRPEVTQLGQRAASTVSSGAKTGQQQLANAAHTVKDKASEKFPAGQPAAPARSPSRRGHDVAFGYRRSPVAAPGPTRQPCQRPDRSRRRPEPRQAARPPTLRR